MIERIKTDIDIMFMGVVRATAPVYPAIKELNIKMLV